MRWRVERDVRRFHIRFGHPAPKVPTVPNEAWRDLRKRLVLEEAQELVEAIESGNLVKVAREAIDLVYVAVGTLVAYGIPVQTCWRAVQLANMSKIAGGVGQKPVKPYGWSPPDLQIQKALEACGWDEREYRVRLLQRQAEVKKT